MTNGPCQRGKDGQAGFTLIELLVAMLIFALLSTVLFSAMRTSASGLERIKSMRTNLADQMATERGLEEWLKEAYPRYVPAPVQGFPGSVDFVGKDNSMTFLAPAPDAQAGGGLSRMRLWIQDNRGAENLMLSTEQELAWIDRPRTMTETLVPSIAAGKFAYFASDGSGTPAYWHNTWANKPTLPILISVRITFPHGDRRFWPDLIVAPLIRADQGCQFIPLTDTCQGR